MIEDGIRLINIEGNGGKKGLLKLLGKNRQQLTIAFLDSDTQTNQDFISAGFTRDQVDDYLILIGHKEFEDAFSDESICSCLNLVWPRNDNAPWVPEHLSGIRNEPNKKFSERLMGLIYQVIIMNIIYATSLFSMEQHATSGKMDISLFIAPM